MAFAQSLQKGQFPVSCKLCMTDTRVTWKCQECDVLMCNRCKETIHPNIKNAKNHKVLNIKEVGLQTEDVSTVQCKHKSRDCVTYCKTCDQLGCRLCIVKIHNGHELGEISEGLKIHTERLKKGQSQMRNHLDILTKQGAKMEDIKKAEKIKYTETKKKIRTRNKELKKEIDQYTDELIKDLDQQWKTFTESIEKQENQVIRLKQNKKDKNQQVEKTLSSNDLDKILEESQKFEKILNEKFDLPEIKYNSIPTLIPGEINNYNFGSLQDISSDISIKVHKEFTTDISTVLFMSPSHDDSFWIGDQNVVQNIKQDRNELKVISSFKMVMCGMAGMPSGDVLLVDSGSILKRMSSKTGEITDSVYSVHPLRTSAVHVTRDNKVIVGAWSGEELYSATGSRVVIVMDEAGISKERYEYDKHHNPLYTYPKRITTTNNGNICVYDRLSADNIGRIVVTGMDGHVINIYTGIPDINTKDKPFKPTTITTTPSDNLIIPELNTHIIHILNNNGQQITYIKGGDVGIYWPFSVAFTTSRKSYIGCTRAVGSSDNGKLFEVQSVGI